MQRIDLVVLTLVLSACGGLSEQDRTALQQRMDRIESDARAQDEPWRAALAREMSAPSASSACPAEVVERRGSQIHNFYETTTAHLGSVDSVRTQRITGSLAFFRSSLAGARTPDDSAIADMRQQLDGMEAQPDPRFEITLVLRSIQRPVLHGATFDGGLVEGRAIVWDHVARAVVCAADARASSSDSVMATAGREAEALTTDLVYRARENAFAALGLGQVQGVDLGGATTSIE